LDRYKQPYESIENSVMTGFAGGFRRRVEPKYAIVWQYCITDTVWSELSWISSTV